MKQNSFKAIDWLNDSAQPIRGGSAHAYSLEKHDNKNDFNPGDFFTPGWSGQSLISKNGIKVKKILMKLWSDCIQQFRGLSQANRSLQELIFEQFKTYCHENNSKINPSFLEKPDFLLREISLPTNKMNSIVLDFIKVSSFKSVTLYLYKIKFLSKLSESLQIELNEHLLKNPSYFFQKVFKATSQNNITIKSLQKNSYSWYRPSSTTNLKIVSIVKVLETISITELMKITSFSNYLKTQKTTYPHSISHQEFGKLINELLIHFPNWIEERNVSELKNQDVLSVNFSGQHVTSLSQSHWLAQNSSDPRGWKNLIFPNFTQRDKNDPYIKYCHELQFLSFLIQLATTYGKNPVKYIIEVYKEKEKVCANDNAEFGQTNLFDGLNTEKKKPLYHRVVLNLLDLPKKNPHHYLTTQISNEINQLINGGYLIILTNQKLFVPSYQEKVKQLLEVAHLEAEFNLESLRNKGEVPDHIYIFSKKEHLNNYTVNERDRNKSSHLSFQLEGKLSQFQLMQLFSTELKNIWKHKKPTTPIYQKDLARGFVVKFHQSVVLDGKILENENQSQNSITHPNFYKNLATNSLTLDNFFKIETNESRTNQTNEKHYLFASDDIQNTSPYVLIVHTPDYLASSIEIIPSDTLEAKKQKYGEAFFQYYNLTPLVRSLNINIFREYFNSSIGRQIIKLTLGGATTKIKSKIRSLLVPKKFYTTANIEFKQDLPSSFNILNLSVDQLQALSIEQLNERLSLFLDDAREFQDLDTSITLSCLSHLKMKLQHINSKDKKMASKVNVKDQEFLQKIIKLNLTSIYPNNPDAYVEFKTNDKLKLYSPVSNTQLIKDPNNGQNRIDLMSGSDCSLSIFSSENLIEFTHQILNQFNEFKPADILQTLKIPSAKDLDSIVDEGKEKSITLATYQQKSTELINDVITGLIL